MAHRIPAVGDEVYCRRGYMLDYEGQWGKVVQTDPPSASQHKCVVRWPDGGDEYIESAYLSLSPRDPSDHSPV